MSNSHKIGVKLRQLPIGDTADGSAWCLKALHPADHDAVPRGMPTHDATSIVNLQFQREFIISAPEAMPDDTWDLDLWVLRDPLLFACYQQAGSSGSAQITGTLENRQLGETYTAGVTALRDLCEAYRVSYMGVTGHLVAPAMADQGTVRAAQYDYPAYQRPYVPANASNLMTTNCITYPDPLLPYGSLIQMPNAYENVAREGVYMPLKLTETDKNFIKTNQLSILYGREQEGGGLSTKEFTPGPRWPWYDNSQSIVLGYKPSDLIGHIAFRGIAKSASVNFIVRCGLDMKVRPETTYAPFNHEPPVYDATAMKMYFEIARRMADAYPASYNATGDLLRVVAGIAQQLWPLVEPKAKELLDKLTQKINQKVQQFVNRNKGIEKPPTVTTTPATKKKPLPQRKTPVPGK